MASTSTRRPPRAPAPGKVVRVWEDDPHATGATPIERPVPKLPSGRMKIEIDVAAPAAAIYEPGTAEFRYWVAAEALQRAGSFWAALVPKGTSWQQATPLTVRLDAGDKLNAFYNRHTLTFFHSTVGSTTVYTGESPDVIAHELGHAVLDALVPQLWDAMSHEVAAFHESFGDMCAILVGLQLESLRDAVLAETSGLYRTSRLSRVAEQLGWAITQRNPCAADPDSLRNAVNCFAYQPASQLPVSGPASTLSSGPHSYSRVFTGAFFEAMAGMVVTSSRSPTADTLLEVSIDAGRLLVSAVRAAPVEPSYFTSVAGHLLEADRLLFDGKYAAALENGFLRRGILSPGTVGVPSVGVASSARGATEHRPELPTLTLAGRDFGVGDRPIVVRAAAETSTLAMAATANDGGPVRPQSAAEAARAFLTELLVRDRVHRPDQADAGPTTTHARVKSHELVDDGETLVAVRRLFEAPRLRCGRGRRLRRPS